MSAVKFPLFDLLPDAERQQQHQKLRMVRYGAGEVIYYVRGKEASFPFLPDEPPPDSTVVGIVDSIHLKRPAKAAPARHPVHKKVRK